MYVATLNYEVGNPATVAEALGGPHKARWREAMESEMASLRENQVFRLVPRPAGKKVVKSKWVFRVKYNETGAVEKFKARVVAKGFGQVEGVNYDQTFSPTVKFESIKQLVALGASKQLHMHQMDVTTAFLYAPLVEEVYMEQPESTCAPGQEHLVMLLLRCLYGLKQAPREWNQHIDEILQTMGFRRIVSDFGLYVLGTGDNALYLALYVDDLFLLCLYLGRISGVKGQLGHKFKMKDLGEARFLLGLEIRRQPNGDVFLCQEKYYGEVLVKFGMDACNPAATPLELGQVFTQGSQELPD